jgi:hypothetical protein
MIIDSIVAYADADTYQARMPVTLLPISRPTSGSSNSTPPGRLPTGRPRHHKGDPGLSCEALTRRALR